MGAFSIGMFVGGLLGMLIMSLCVVASRAEEAERRYYEDLDKKQGV